MEKISGTWLWPNGQGVVITLQSQVWESSNPGAHSLNCSKPGANVPNCISDKTTSMDIDGSTLVHTTVHTRVESVGLT